MYWGWKYSALNCAKNPSIKYASTTKTPRNRAIFSNIKLSDFLYCTIAEASQYGDGRSRGDARSALIYKAIFRRVLNFLYFDRNQLMPQRAVSVVSAYFAPIFGQGRSAARCAVHQKQPGIRYMVAVVVVTFAASSLCKQVTNRRFLRSKVDIIVNTTNEFALFPSGASPFFSGRLQ